MKPSVTFLFAAAATFGVCGCSARTSVDVRPLSPNQPVAAATPSMAQGRMLYGRGEYALAIEAFRRAIRENPDRADGYNALASAYDMIGRFDLARVNYELALARSPADGRIYRNMARSLTMQGRPDEAAELLAEWKAIDAQSVVAERTDKPGSTEVAVASPIAASLPEPPRVQDAAKPVDATPPAKTLTTVLSEEVRRIEKAGSTSPAQPLADPPIIASGPTVRIVLDAPAPAPASPPVVRVAPAAGQPLAAKRRPNVTIALEAPAPVRKAAGSAIRVLNAGAASGSARRMQSLLARQGTPSYVGNANRKLAQSWIVFPRSSRAQAIRLQRQLLFPVKILMDDRATRVTLLIGRDGGLARSRARSSGLRG